LCRCERRIPVSWGVFVEGPDDIELWTRWLRFVPVGCDGCAGVRTAIDDVRRRSIPGCVGIVDADLDRMRAHFISDVDIVVSEKHDHECDIVCSPAFEHFLLSLPEAAPQLAILAQPSATLRDAIRLRALPFGVLRWVLHDRGIEFPSRLTPKNPKLIDRQTWRLDLDALLDEAAIVLGIGRTAVDTEVSQRAVAVSDEWHVCNGHDVVTLLHLAFATIKCAAERCRSEKAIGWALRSAVDSSHLTTLSMWQQLAAWEIRSAPFLVRR
jgi:hypothetical protein